MPAAQLAQVPLEVAPVAALEVPTGQGVAAPMAAAGQYAPAGQAAHDDAPAAAKVPMAHWVGAAEPGGQ